MTRPAPTAKIYTLPPVVTARLWLHAHTSLRNTDVSMICFPGAASKYSNTYLCSDAIFPNKPALFFKKNKTFLKKNLLKHARWYETSSIIVCVNFQELTCTVCQRLSKKDHGVEIIGVRSGLDA